MWPGFQISAISEVMTSWVLFNHFAMEEGDGGRCNCWAYTAERPGFSIVEVLFIHMLCSRQKILAVPHTSSALRREGHLLGSDQIWRRAPQITTNEKKSEPAPIVCFRVGGSFSQNPKTTFMLGPGGMHVEHAASAPRCRGAVDQRCVEMITWEGSPTCILHLHLIDLHSFTWLPSGAVRNSWH